MTEKYIPASEVRRWRDMWVQHGTPDQIGCARTLDALLASAVELTLLPAKVEDRSGEIEFKDDSAVELTQNTGHYPPIVEAQVELPEPGRITGRDVHREWRDGMFEQGRKVAFERREWDTLKNEDQQLDERIAERLNALARPVPDDKLREPAPPRPRAKRGNTSAQRSTAQIITWNCNGCVRRVDIRKPPMCEHEHTERGVAYEYREDCGAVRHWSRGKPDDWHTCELCSTDAFLRKEG